MSNVILGLGSNLGDRLAYLRRGLQLLKHVPQLVITQISPLYLSDALLPDNAPNIWNMPFLNCAVSCETTLSPAEVLRQVNQIEQSIGRTREKHWAPRVIDIDLLAWDDLVQLDESLHLPHPRLLERPFALWPLADVAPRWVYPASGQTAAEIALTFGSRFDGQAPFHTRQIAQRIDTPQLIGILNITPDSFSDGGRVTESNAVQLAHDLVLAGAEILDLGAEATNPKAAAISATEEWKRLSPVLSAILDQRSGLLIQPKISIDTRHAENAKKALAFGVDWINDVSGLQDPLMRQIAADSSCDWVVMHHLGIPVNRSVTLPRNQHPVDLILGWAKKHLSALTEQGIARERIIFDPGIGFGKTAEQCLDILKEVSRFQQLGTRLLIGHSRKLFLGQFTPRPFAERDPESAVLSLYLRQIDYLRVHDVDFHARAFKVASAMGTAANV